MRVWAPNESTSGLANTGIFNIATGQPFQYKGQYGYYTDGTTGLCYCINRYYDPNVGRWTERDASGLCGGVNVYAYANADPVLAADPDGLETFAGDTHGYPFCAWLAPGNWRHSHNGWDKKRVMHAIMETDDHSIGIWGHGNRGRIYINPTEYLDPHDVRVIGCWRTAHHKHKFNYFMVNECDVMADPGMVAAIKTISLSVQGYTGTCYGLAYQRKEWK